MVLLLLVLFAVRLDVLFSYQYNDLYTSSAKSVPRQRIGQPRRSKQSGIHGFWMSLVHFSVLAAIYIAELLVDIYLTQRFIVAWRMWLTGRLTDDWLDGKAYYRDLFIDEHHRQPRPAHPAGHRHLHHRCRRHAEHPVQRAPEHPALRRASTPWPR